MKKLIWIIIFLKINFLAFSQNKIPYLDFSPVIDGNDQDWHSLKPYIPQNKNVLSVNQNYYNLAFDENYLYGIFKVFDHHLIVLAQDSSGSERLSFNDSIELYLDTKNDSEKKMDKNDFQIIIDLNGKLTVFRGGDRYLLQVDEAHVPKDTITHNFVITSKSKIWGSINNNLDQDSRYIIEFKIPWATMGVTLHQNYKLKYDIAFNDADKYLDILPLHENDTIPQYSFENIKGESDFGYPEKWHTATLSGQASIWKNINFFVQKHWWQLAFLLFLFFITIIFYLIKSLTQTSILQKLEIEKQKSSLPQTIEEPQIVQKAKIYILKNLDLNISPSQLASELSMSLRQLQRIFKDQLNTTPTHYITAIKMEQAVILLKQTENTVAEVSYAVGYTDPAYFTKTFKKYFNQNPSSFVKH